jgi:UDP-3-O-[3-hydroxymyristoyl] glucosamine N-acyltransferase
MIRGEDVAAAAGVTLVGQPGIEVRGPEPLPDAVPGALCWLKSWEGRHAAAIDRLDGIVLVAPVPSDPAGQAASERLAVRNALVLVPEPRLAYARLLAAFFSHLEAQVPPGIDPSARIDTSARIGSGVTIGAFCFVGADVEIGDGTVLHPGVIVHSRTRIGRNCVVNSGAVLGTRGFGFVRDADGRLVHFPQVGTVEIEDDVEIQAGTMVSRPGTGTTRIRRGAKIDNLCHIGHNADIGSDSVVTACTEVGAGVVVEEGAWVGPNSCSIEGVRLGKGSFTGIGSVVLHDVPPGATVAGSPAEPIEAVRNTRRALRRLVESEG